MAFGLDLSPRAKGERSWQRSTTRNSARMWRRVPESNPGHFDGNKRNALSSMPQFLFSFCRIQVFISRNSRFHQKNQVLKISSKESSVQFERINFVSSESSLRRINQICVSKELILHRMNQVFVYDYERRRTRYYDFFNSFFFPFTKLQTTYCKLQITNE